MGPRGLLSLVVAVSLAAMCHAFAPPPPLWRSSGSTRPPRCAHRPRLQSTAFPTASASAEAPGGDRGEDDDGQVPSTFPPVEVKDSEGRTSFSVMPPDCWPHGTGEEGASGVKDVLIKPSFGWGEGEHPTTFMCLKFLAEHLGPLEAPSMLDYGTGSGVLAIAAKRLGASRVVGVDKDDEILECAEENAALNFGDGHGIELVHGRSVTPGTRGLFLADGMSTTFDVTVANMLAPALVRLAPVIVSAVKEEGRKGAGGGEGGILALSGMRRDQVRDVKAAYTAQGVAFFEEEAREGAAPGAAWAEWVLLKGRRAAMTDEQARERAAMLSDLAVG